jgi:hypothetical protein
MRVDNPATSLWPAPRPPRSRTGRGESSGRLPWVEVGQQFLAGVEAEPE